MIEIQRILCPIDFSDYSRHALDHAVALARRYESTITVLHVFSTVPVAAYAPGMPGFEPIVLTRADRDQLLAELKRFVETESAPGVSMDATIREGDTTSEILNQATDMKAELLVMGTHGRSGFERFLLGISDREGAAEGELSGADRAAASSRRGARDSGAVQTDSVSGGLLRLFDAGVELRDVAGAGGRRASDGVACDDGRTGASRLTRTARSS